MGTDAAMDAPSMPVSPSSTALLYDEPLTVPVLRPRLDPSSSSTMQPSPSESPASSPSLSPHLSDPIQITSPLNLSPAASGWSVSWPQVPGYEAAVLGEEIYVQYPHSNPTNELVAPLRRQKSVFRRQISTLRRQKKRWSVLPPGPEVIRPQVDAVINYLQHELGLQRSSYLHALFSYAFSGFAEAIEERRSIMWVSQPLVVTDEIRHLLDTEMVLSDPPAEPWALSLDHLLPERINNSFEVAIEVPNTTLYRTCHICEGRGTSRCTTCRGKSLILCKECKSTGVAKGGAMCQGCEGLGCKKCDMCKNSGRHVCISCKGHGTIRLFLLLRAFWVHHSHSFTDTNNYPLGTDPAVSLDTVDAAYTTSDISELAHLDSLTKTEVEAFTHLLRVQLLTKSLPTSNLRTFVYNIRIIPLFEIVYTKNRMFMSKRKLKYLVYGNTIKGVMKVDKSVEPNNTLGSTATEGLDK